MPEDIHTAVNTQCPSNFTCTNNTSGTTSIADFVPAGAVTMPACLNNASATSLTAASFDGIALNTPIKASQFNAAQQTIQNELTRRSISAANTTTVAVNQKIVLSNSFSALQANLTRLGYPIAAGDLPVAGSSKITVTNFTKVAEKINASTGECTCKTRCTCNARGDNTNQTPAPANINDTAGVDCQSRCACNCNAQTTGTNTYCICDGRCTCHTHTASTNCNCVSHCTCNTRCTCNCNLVNTSCVCNLRATVQCTCNIRNVCATFT